MAPGPGDGSSKAPRDLRRGFGESEARHPASIGESRCEEWRAAKRAFTMTGGRLLFAIATSGCVLIGIRFEERDLTHSHTR